MTQRDLQSRLEALYGGGTTNALAVKLAKDLGISPRATNYWISGERPCPPWLDVAIEALEMRKVWKPV